MNFHEDFSARVLSTSGVFVDFCGLLGHVFAQIVRASVEVFSRSRSTSLACR